VERRESAYVRHGTATFIPNRDVVTGRVIAPAHGPTRTAADFVAHVRQAVASDPAATRWPCVLDNLNVHQPEALGYSGAAVSGLADDLGVKGQVGILAHASPHDVGSCRYSMIGVAAVRTVQQGLPAATPNTACGSVACGRPTDGDHRMAARPMMWHAGMESAWQQNPAPGSVQWRARARLTPCTRRLSCQFAYTSA